MQRANPTCASLGDSHGAYIVIYTCVYVRAGLRILMTKKRDVTSGFVHVAVQSKKERKYARVSFVIDRKRSRLL